MLTNKELHRLRAFNASLPSPIGDEALLVKVFTHRSAVNEYKGLSESNERLEFLGDAVLSGVISHILYREYPEIDEGTLTDFRARLVNRGALAEVAETLKLGDYLILGKGEERGGGRASQTILSCTVEALIGAIYLDGGYDRVSDFISKLTSPLIKDLDTGTVHFDYKPRLQKLCQSVFKCEPVYEVVRESGPPHDMTFEVDVTVEGRRLGTGRGQKKKEGEQEAARRALERLAKETEEAGGEREEER